MRIDIDEDLCEANGLCMRLAPEVFRVAPDDDVVQLLDASPPEAVRDRLADAVRSCPRGAISVSG